MSAILKQYKTTIRFIVVFVGLYLVLNTLYGLYIESYTPDADPATVLVTKQVAWVLSVFHGDVAYTNFPGYASIPLTLSGKSVVHVFEGCNGLNVLIVYLSFLIAFSGKPKLTLIYLLVGGLIIYLMNLLRVGLLFEVALYFPDQLYFFHKFLFTGIIYAVVFVIWYFWVRAVRSHERGADTSSK